MNARRHVSTIRYLCALGVLVNALAPPAYGQVVGYVKRNLVSDGSAQAANTDRNLVNPWGLAFNPDGPVWIANNGTGVITAYDGTGATQGFTVRIPAAGNSNAAGKPTGIVYNPSETFVVSQPGAAGSSRFIFATEDGVIAGWSPRGFGENAVRAVDNSSKNAVYKGLAIASASNGQRLYATDFHNARIDVFDSNFQQINLPGSFVDGAIPTGFAPFGIQNINGRIYVSYAMQDTAKMDNVAGPGMGYVNVFDVDGRLIKRLISGGELNAPWGMAQAPASVGGTLLVGNFGDGKINTYNPETGQLFGTLTEAVSGEPLQVEGLWAIAFGSGVSNLPANTLFFTAGPGDEKQGVFGRIDSTRTGR